MKIFYVSKLCAPEVFSSFFDGATRRPAQQAQNYHRLLSEGLAANGSVPVYAIGARPVSRRITKKWWFSSSRNPSSREPTLTYWCLPTANAPGLTQAMLFLGTMIALARKAQRGDAVVADALNTSMAAAAMVVARAKGLPVMGIVTDVPGHARSSTHPTLRRMSLRIMSGFTHYLFLTEPMNDVINGRGAPYLVIEGQADRRAAESENTFEDKYSAIVCMYTGELAREYGIIRLMDAFVLANVPNAELHLYGDGELVSEIEAYQLRHPAIRYQGVRPNREIIDLQKKATLLINPRPTDQDFTRYSFPSKNIEYMASGTPVLTTDLPGMPREYLPYIFVFQDETTEGMAACLSLVLSLPRRELHIRGAESQKFITTEKNNMKQAGRILELLAQGLQRGSMPEKGIAKRRSGLQGHVS